MEDTQIQPRTKVLKNGAVYDLDKGRIVANPGGGTGAFTPETSRKAKEILAEKKREAIVRGASRVLVRSGEWETPNNLDVAEAIAEAVMLKALNPENPKQVDAARFIMQESGIAESQTPTSEDAQQFAAIGDAVVQIVAFLREIHEPRDVIDGEARDVTDTRSE